MLTIRIANSKKENIQMETKNERYFLEIARHKNLTKAATYLFVTQSSLSQFLTKEETELGVKLFIRDKKELQLTYAGELYRDACQNVMDIKQKLYRDLADLAQSKTGITRLGITPQWGGLAVAEIMPDFISRFPNSKLILTEDTAHPLLEQISANNLDLALIALNEDVPSQFPDIPISREELFLAVPFALAESVSKEAPGAFQYDNDGQRSVMLDTFRTSPFIVSRERTIIRDITNNMFRVWNFIPDIVCEINNHKAQLEMVAHGLGLTVIPRSYALEDGRIQYFRIQPGWFWKVSMVLRRDYELSQSDLHLISLLQNYYAI